MAQFGKINIPEPVKPAYPSWLRFVAVGSLVVVGLAAVGVVYWLWLFAGKKDKKKAKTVLIGVIGLIVSWLIIRFLLWLFFGDLWCLGNLLCSKDYGWFMGQ